MKELVSQLDMFLLEAWILNRGVITCWLPKKLPLAGVPFGGVTFDFYQPSK